MDGRTDGWMEYLYKCTQQVLNSLCKAPSQLSSCSWEQKRTNYISFSHCIIVSMFCWEQKVVQLLSRRLALKTRMGVLPILL